MLLLAGRITSRRSHGPRADQRKGGGRATCCSAQSPSDGFQSAGREGGEDDDARDKRRGALTCCRAREDPPRHARNRERVWWCAAQNRHLQQPSGGSNATSAQCTRPFTADPSSQLGLQTCLRAEAHRRNPMQHYRQHEQPACQIIYKLPCAMTRAIATMLMMRIMMMITRVVADGMQCIDQWHW